MTLRTRPPTGQVAFPLILVEGEEKAGKSYAALQLSASPRVGRTFVLDLMDGTADEYAELGPYEVLEHDGTHRSMVEQIREACAVPSDPEKPNVVIADCGTPYWQMLVEWANARALRSKDGRKRLADDPDAEVPIPMNIWNDVAARWAELALPLKRFPGIGIITAQGKEVSAIDANGRPIPKTKEWKVVAHSSLPAIVSAWVRLERPHKAKLIGVRSLHEEFGAKATDLGNGQGILERVVFEILGAGTFAPNQSVAPNAETGTGADATPTWDDLGWADQTDHDAALEQVQGCARSLEPVHADALKAWLKDQGWRWPYTRVQIDAWADKCEELSKPACEYCGESPCVCAPDDDGSDADDGLDLAYEGTDGSDGTGQML